ncbi:hypothetical protein Bcop_2126 [Bacteroides coprosuis DSM 18011]|uniref:Uncharacterized protein n=1 Tax=Bacteroides coprosuis DSM 18011 TaxID=679937 RepID=F3ZTC9_9BACE|nr:ATP-binding protein [Bacteroides coprosuis]EGJ72297.1 hypothetical protein Bcop_2126 [Bacteroides coprosuis DSM 18011]
MQKNRSKDMKADIKGIITSLNINEGNFLIPIFEAVVNSIQSIHEQVKLEPKHKGEIEVIIERDKITTDIYEGKPNIEVNYPIAKITIKDNGIGFNDVNLKSFNTAHSTKKIKIGGKGLGRFTMLSVFKNISVESIFKVGDKHYKREIPFTTEYKEEDAKKTIVHGAKSTGTITILSGLKEKFLKQSINYSQEVIADNILKHCLLYFINNDEPKILIREKDCADINLSTQFNPKDFLINEYLEEKIKNKTFNFYLVKEYKSSFNFYSYTADNRTVETKKTNTILPIFKSKVTNSDQECYVGVYITSDFFNKRVQHNRLEIRFDKANDMANFDTVSEKEVEDKVVEIIERQFAGILKERETSNEAKVKDYLRHDGIGYRWLDVDSKFLQSIPDDADIKKLDDLFHNLEYKAKNDLNKRKEKLLSRDYSNKKEYKELLNEVLSAVGKQNESKLAQYVSHRKVVIDLLGKYLEWQNEQKKYKEESALHNLFFTMGGTEKDIAHSQHNLWLIDERLAYFKYIRSDIAQLYHGLSNTESKKEPDITLYDYDLYDKSYKYGDVSSEGEIKTIVFVEFKRPHRDNLTFQEYQRQMMDQVKGLDQGIENYKGGYLNVSQNKTIFFYYVCDVKDFNKIMKDAKEFGSFRTSPYGTLIRFDQDRIEEIMTYQQVKSSSIQRNRAFFKNLGID